MSAATQTPTAAEPGPETCTILEVSPKQHVLWTMPRDVYDLVTIGLENWHWTHGSYWGGHRRPRATVERVLQVLEDGGCPDIRASITRTVRPAPEPGIRGHGADILITDTLPDTP